MNTQTQLAERNPDTVARHSNAQAQKGPTIVPAVDIYEDAHGITLWADLPGVSRDRLNVRVQDGSLFIEGEASIDTPDGLRLHHAEIRAPRFARAFSLSADFDTSKIDANLNDGVLKLSIPRREEARPRRIEVSVG
ncbi:Hsp20/alpha crystallin family protein [Caballeronia sp. SBC2]|uniref:Hsp20/alpha crystallin family protein n=1 Tax=Caballeronia sp. SBC2 TaxID=2705547 RepID=UPI0013E1AB9E|nr:Hsp20/alpha crystallin family protein [Caballeronia sp. SBC2]QIE30418.1 Spore protein SP21 [Caballeronia sp. SBC2]